MKAFGLELLLLPANGRVCVCCSIALRPASRVLHCKRMGYATAVNTTTATRRRQCNCIHNGYGENEGAPLVATPNALDILGVCPCKMYIRVQSPAIVCNKAQAMLIHSFSSQAFSLAPWVAALARSGTLVSIQSRIIDPKPPAQQLTHSSDLTVSTALVPLAGPCFFNGPQHICKVALQLPRLLAAAANGAANFTGASNSSLARAPRHLAMHPPDPPPCRPDCEFLQQPQPRAQPFALHWCTSCAVRRRHRRDGGCGGRGWASQAAHVMP